MKIQFDANLNFQREAINAVVDLFNGQEICQINFTVAPLHLESECTIKKSN
jgi:type III restriction enzyme